MHLYRYLAKQIHHNPNGDPNIGHRAFKTQREERERIIKSLTNTLRIIESLEKAAQTIKEACKKNPNGLPF